jgi:two-component system, OmpR family, osmolarity sensor histidine kinase EnvZ
LRYLLDQINSATDMAQAQDRASALAGALDLLVALPAISPEPAADLRRIWDLSGRVVIETLRDGPAEIRRAVLDGQNGEVRLWLDTEHGVMEVAIERRRVSASNPHQLLVVMLATSVLMTVIAYLFLRNQLRPITRLAAAADAFGKGRHVPYRPGGAVEVRAAGHAFLDMRARIERQIEQRTLMLSGVSHDLRTPLTRMRLALSLMPQDDDSRALEADVAQMERMVDEFLSFSRGDALDEIELVDPASLVAGVVATARRGGQQVTLRPPEGQGQVMLRPAAIARALENLIGNAVRHGSRAEVGVHLTERSLRFEVEDDGPGIPKDRRDEAVRPFSRLDDARDPNRGGGVGLGLAITADIARSHGGTLRLGESDRLGGLKAEIVLAR